MQLSRELPFHSMYPSLHINLQNLSRNVQVIKNLLDGAGIETVAVTKAFCGDPVLAKVFVDHGVTTLADSRLYNLERMADIPARKMLLRSPALNEAEDAVRLADVSLVSHSEVAAALSRYATGQKKTHSVILMVDLGDLREGVFCRETAIETAREITKLPYVTLEGLGANFCCFNGLIPSFKDMITLSRLASDITAVTGVPIKTISGGNSSNVHLLMDGQNTNHFTQLRIGDAFLFGRETAYGADIPGTINNCFTLRAEIIEKQKKPSVFAGNRGTDGFGNQPTLEDRGNRWKALCAIGRQDVPLETLTPCDNRISILGGSSDHLILDIDECADDYALGDTLDFSPGYGGILSAMASPYVQRVYQ